MENTSIPSSIIEPVSNSISVATPKNNRNLLILTYSFFILLLMASTGYFYYQNQQLKSMLASYQTTPSLTPTATPDPNANWKTYTNTKYGFSIKYPTPDPNDSTEKFNTYTDDLIEVSGLDSLIFRVEPILTKNDPITWWSTQKIDPYSQKPAKCFSKETVQVIKSLYEPDKNVVDFGRKVVVLDGLQSSESKIGSCPEPGTVRIILISLDGKLLRITYTWSSMSEQILSTFKFLGRGETTIDHGNTVVVYEPPLSNQDYLTNRNIIEQKVVSPFMDYWKEKESKDYVVSLLISLQKNENIKNDYPYQLIAINKGGGQIYESLRQVGGQLDWWIPTCQKCEFSNEFTTKYPEIVKRTQ